MTSLKIKNLKVEIAVLNIDGILHKTLHIPFKSGFWVCLTAINEYGEKESFPLVDEDFKVKIFALYDEALKDAARLLNKYLN